LSISFPSTCNCCFLYHCVYHLSVNFVILLYFFICLMCVSNNVCIS
jgi:hypothetical protein